MKELSQKPDYEMMWKVECEINQKLKQENARLREELNNSINFHCKYYLTNGSGTVSCHYEEMEKSE